MYIYACVFVYVSDINYVVVNYHYYSCAVYNLASLAAVLSIRLTKVIFVSNFVVTLEVTIIEFYLHLLR